MLKLKISDYSTHSQHFILITYISFKRMSYVTEQDSRAFLTPGPNRNIYYAALFVTSLHILTELVKP
jgi:hypothetical protein